MTAGQISDYTGAAALLVDRGYDADWIRGALQTKGILPCIPGNEHVEYVKRRFRRRRGIEIMFGRLKNWGRIATRYHRYPTVIFWL